MKRTMEEFEKYEIEYPLLYEDINAEFLGACFVSYFYICKEGTYASFEYGRYGNPTTQTAEKKIRYELSEIDFRDPLLDIF